MRAIFRTYSSRPVRRGLSFFEFIGCLAAMIGGVFLGSAYLGIDMKDMAIGVLAKADVIKPEFFLADEVQTANPTDSDSKQGASQSAATNEPGKLVDEQLLTEVDSTQESTDPSEANSKSHFKSTPQPTKAERRNATRAYWDVLTECLLQEGNNRSQGLRAEDELQLYDYLVSRKTGHEQAIKSLQQLNEFGVDERLLAHGRQVTTWNKSAVKLFERALSLLTDGPSAGITGPFAQTWQSSATQLRMEESLIVDKHKAVAGYLDHEYPEIAPFEPAFKK
ncbi:hypothetical protein [Bythopirellula goksoeyrii]|uniref:Uncharacterized protein n=1 Tax=Bythopirellula goksoeyrii TaxID=1400387 RepID=A0A5B9QCV2_9BACT|nr:hypothetical protein [Bythopirellula goksoeyrii]QEG34776.1 hypothetical protein Pr1d_20600 [Bythopirellula goksoeyrii]